MPREPKQRAENSIEPSDDCSVDETDSDAHPPASYYYDDAHGYQDYDPENQGEDDEFDD
jgi:hypothetical protein